MAVAVVGDGGPAQLRAESTRKLGELLRDVYRDNPERPRFFCPDETNSHRLGAAFEASDHGLMKTSGRRT